MGCCTSTDSSNLGNDTPANSNNSTPRTQEHNQSDDEGEFNNNDGQTTNLLVELNNNNNNNALNQQQQQEQQQEVQQEQQEVQQEQQQEVQQEQQEEVQQEQQHEVQQEQQQEQQQEVQQEQQQEQQQEVQRELEVDRGDDLIPLRHAATNMKKKYNNNINMVEYYDENVDDELDQEELVMEGDTLVKTLTNPAYHAHKVAIVKKANGKYVVRKAYPPTHRRFDEVVLYTDDNYKLGGRHPCCTMLLAAPRHSGYFEVGRCVTVQEVAPRAVNKRHLQKILARSKATLPSCKKNDSMKIEEEFSDGDDLHFYLECIKNKLQSFAHLSKSEKATNKDYIEFRAHQVQFAKAVARQLIEYVFWLETVMRVGPHGNINPRTILLRRDGCVKMKFFNNFTEEMIRTNPFHYWKECAYASPECSRTVQGRMEFGYQNDIWAIGAVLFSIVTGENYLPEYRRKDPYKLNTGQDPAESERPAISSSPFKDNPKQNNNNFVRKNERSAKGIDVPVNLGTPTSTMSEEPSSSVNNPRNKLNASSSPSSGGPAPGQRAETLINHYNSSSLGNSQIAAASCTTVPDNNCAATTTALDGEDTEIAADEVPPAKPVKGIDVSNFAAHEIRDEQQDSNTTKYDEFMKCVVEVNSFMNEDTDSDTKTRNWSQWFERCGDPALAYLIKWCLTRDRTTRPTAEQLLSFMYVSGTGMTQSNYTQPTATFEQRCKLTKIVVPGRAFERVKNEKNVEMGWSMVLPWSKTYDAWGTDMAQLSQGYTATPQTAASRPRQRRQQPTSHLLREKDQNFGEQLYDVLRHHRDARNGPTRMYQHMMNFSDEILRFSYPLTAEVLELRRSFKCPHLNMRLEDELENLANWEIGERIGDILVDESRTHYQERNRVNMQNIIDAQARENIDNQRRQVIGGRLSCSMIAMSRAMCFFADAYTNCNFSQDLEASDAESESTQLQNGRQRLRTLESLNELHGARIVPGSRVAGSSFGARRTNCPNFILDSSQDMFSPTGENTHQTSSDENEEEEEYSDFHCYSFNDDN